MSAKSVSGILIAGGFVVLNLAGCATSADLRKGASAEIGSIYELQQEWDEVEERVGKPNIEFRKQYAKSLQTLNNVMAERDEYKEAVEWSKR